MRLSGLDRLPGSARIWIFGAEREIGGAEAARLLAAVDRFLDRWTAHGTPLRAAREWRYDRFLIVGVDQVAAPPSGCSVDDLTRALRAAEGEFGVRFLGNETVWYRDDAGRVRGASRPEFRRLAQEGGATAASIVFDNSITGLAELRGGRWEGPASERWQAAFFEAPRSPTGG